MARRTCRTVRITFGLGIGFTLGCAVCEAMLISSLRSISHKRGLVLKLGLRCEIRDGPHWQGGEVRSDEVPLMGGGQAGCPEDALSGRPASLVEVLICYRAKIGPAVLA